MAEPGAPGGAEPSDPAADPAAAIAALRRRGADRLDPVRFRFIEALAGRALAHRGAARQLLDRRLATALAEYREVFARAEVEAGDTVARVAGHFPAAGEELRRLFGAGDFDGLRRLVAELHCSEQRGPLADLLAHIAQHSPQWVDADRPQAPPGELKSLRHFRSTWSQLSVDRQVAEAIAQGPENAGPLNSQRLVLQSLSLMRAISPDYLKRFMSYADALLWLDRANSGSMPAERNPARGEGERKRKAAAARSR